MANDFLKNSIGAVWGTNHALFVALPGGTGCGGRFPVRARQRWCCPWPSGAGGARDRAGAPRSRSAHALGQKRWKTGAIAIPDFRTRKPRSMLASALQRLTISTGCIQHVRDQDQFAIGQPGAFQRAFIDRVGEALRRQIDLDQVRVGDGSVETGRRPSARSTFINSVHCGLEPAFLAACRTGWVEAKDVGNEISFSRVSSK